MDNTRKSLMLTSIINVLKLPNLKQAKIHPVITGYFNEAIGLFKDMHKSAIAWEANQKIGNVSLDALYMIPEVLKLYHANKTKILPLINSGTHNEDVRFFKTMYALLDDFNNKKKITRMQKQMLNFFFKEWKINVDSASRYNRSKNDEFHFAFA